MNELSKAQKATVRILELLYLGWGFHDEGGNLVSYSQDDYKLWCSDESKTPLEMIEGFAYHFSFYHPEALEYMTRGQALSILITPEAIYEASVKLHERDNAVKRDIIWLIDKMKLLNQVYSLCFDTTDKPEIELTSGRGATEAIFTVSEDGDLMHNPYYLNLDLKAFLEGDTEQDET